MRLRPAVFSLLAAAALLAGCAAPATTPASHTPPSDTVAPAPARVTPVKVDTRCKRDADCAVKNLGSCCGERPACVNADSPTDPAAVQAQCQASGRRGLCGFRQISTCQCQAGTCVPADSGPGLSNDPAPASTQVR